ncbi:MAG: glycerophosphodiester phosphodiesterase [Gemmatimonadota bacterium]
MTLPRQLILGHRGAPLEAAENTLRSLALAVERGADGVELDVRRSRDGVPVVIHDDSLERTMGVGNAVSRLDWPAIQRLTAARVPSLAQVAAWAAASGAWLNVELKAGGFEDIVIEALANTGVLGRTIISSFDPYAVRRAGDIDPAVRRFLLARAWDASAERDLEASDAVGVCLGVDAATGPVLEHLSARKLPVIVWTVNDADRLRELLEGGVAGIISDDPAMAAGIRARTSRTNVD